MLSATMPYLNTSLRVLQSNNYGLAHLLPRSTRTSGSTAKGKTVDYPLLSTYHTQRLTNNKRNASRP